MFVLCLSTRPNWPMHQQRKRSSQTYDSIHIDPQCRPVRGLQLFRLLVLGAILLSLSSGSLFGQHAVDPAQRYHRLICLMHLTGSGKS
jgi:hypothetical protein